MKKTIIIIIAFIAVSGLNAQPFNFNINFALGTPQGDFKQSLDRNAYGLDLGFTYQLNANSPLHLGVGFMYQNYGWRERETQFVDGVPEVDVRVRTTNNLITPQFIMRLEPKYGAFSPFLEGSVGFNYLYTESSIRDLYGDEEIASNVNYDYYTSNYGIGGGLKIRIWEGYDNTENFFGVHLMIKAKYVLGGEAQYIKEGDLTTQGNDLEYIVTRSRTDLKTFDVGIVFNF